MERFWNGSCIRKNKEMVENLQRYGVMDSKKVEEVMETIDRSLFVPDGTPPYVDSPMQIGYNATISAPHMHATCLKLLENYLQPGMRALDVGSVLPYLLKAKAAKSDKGSYCLRRKVKRAPERIKFSEIGVGIISEWTGYLTACFAVMVGPQGRVVGIEHIPELAESSIKNIEKSEAGTLLKEGSISIHVGDGRQGWPDLAPYDAIHVGAAAPEIPPALIEQLKPDGRLVIPVGKISQELKVVDKNTDGTLSVRVEFSVRYVPLTSREAQLRGC
ncbi:Protein-L-isoaspartate O-methyltransferase 2 [Orobanche hederae]